MAPSVASRFALTLSRTARSTTSSAIRDLLRLTEAPDVRSLAGGLPAPDCLPVQRVQRAADAILVREGPRALQYGPTEGTAELRTLVASQVVAAVEDTIVTTGSQQGIDLVVAALVDPGDTVVVESPTYLGALQPLTAARANLEPVPGDEGGLRTDVLAERLAEGLRPRLCYVVTEFANPSGACLAPERRIELAALAERYGFVILEDDPYGALRYRGTPGPSLRSHAPDHVVRLGSASKILAPGLRVGWLGSPSWLTPALVRAKQAVDLHTSTFDQLLVAELLADERWLAHHLTRIVAFSGGRADALTRSLAVHLGTALSARRPDGGMFLWAQLADPALDSTVLLPAALRAGVAYVPGAAFHVADQRGATAGYGHLRLCFTTLDADGLDEAVRRLSTVLT